MFRRRNGDGKPPEITEAEERRDEQFAEVDRVLAHVQQIRVSLSAIEDYALSERLRVKLRGGCP